VSGYGGHKKKKDNSTENSSTTGVPKFFQQWQHCWVKCIAAEGEYCKDDPSQ